MIRTIVSNFLKICGPKPKIQYYRFGFNPSGYLREDLKNCFFGNQNLLKHFQAPKIIKALDVKPHEQVLDFGCGTGYITVEIAKLASTTIGVDINPFIKQINIPFFLKGKLSFLFYKEFIEMQDLQFDKILLSEVILSVPSADDLLVFLKLKLKPNGTILLVNGLSRQFIKDKVYSCNILLNICKIFNSNTSNTYEEYEQKLCMNFGNKEKHLLSKESIIELFSKHKYKMNHCTFAPSSLIGNIIELRQFMVYPAMKYPNFVSFIFYRILFSIFKFWPINYKSGFIAEFSKVKQGESV